MPVKDYMSLQDTYIDVQRNMHRGRDTSCDGRAVLK